MNHSATRTGTVRKTNPGVALKGRERLSDSGERTGVKKKARSTPAHPPGRHSAASFINNASKARKSRKRTVIRQLESAGNQVTETLSPTEDTTARRFLRV